MRRVNTCLAPRGPGTARVVASQRPHFEHMPAEKVSYPVNISLGGVLPIVCRGNSGTGTSPHSGPHGVHGHHHICGPAF